MSSYKMGNLLIDEVEILFRQIHPNSYLNGRLASDRFRPQPADDGKMSTDRGAVTTAVEAHALYTASGRRSAAVFGVSVGEFWSENLQCYSDPLSAQDSQPENFAHAVVDYNELDEKQWKNISKRLTVFAISRGCLHPEDK